MYLARQLAGARVELAEALAELEALGERADPLRLAGDLASAGQLLPPLETLQSQHARLAAALAGSRQRCEEATEHQRALDAAQLPVPTGEGVLAERLEREVLRCDQAGEEMRQRLGDELRELQQIAQRIERETAGVVRLIALLEYRQLLATGCELERQVEQYGEEGVEACWIESGEERYGPFELEQPLAVGATTVVVRSGGLDISVFDADQGDLLGASSDGRLTLQIPDESGDRYPMTFSLSERCFDLVMKLEYLLRECDRLLGATDGAAGDGGSWVTACAAVLSRPEVRQALEREQKQRRAQWERLRDQLRRLAPRKAALRRQRLAEYAEQWVPALRRQRHEAQRAWQQASARLGEIAALCDRDLETDRLLIPSRHAREYAQLQQQRQNAADQIDRTDRLIREMEQRLAAAAPAA